MFASEPPGKQADGGLGSTDRPTNEENLPTTPVLVDTIRVRGPVLDYDQRDVRYRRRSDRNGEVVDEFTGATYRVQSDLLVAVDHLNETRTPHASFEISVPRILRNENTRGSTLGEVREAVSWAFEEAAHHVAWSAGPEQLRITRIDLVNDFMVGDPAPLMRALASMSGTRAGLAVLHADPGFAGVQTLRRGFPERWSVYAYDKGREVLARAASTRDEHRARLLRRRAPGVRGTLRVETRLRKPALVNAGLVQVADLEDETLHTTADRYRGRAGFKEVLVGADDHRSRVVALYSGPHKRHADAVLGHLEAQRLGITSPVDRKTAANRERIAGLYGLTSSTASLSGPSLRLDFRSNQAREVLLRPCRMTRSTSSSVTKKP